LEWGDRDQARKACAELAERFRKAKEQFPTADYYRFFPGLSGEDHGVEIPGSD
jgi:hypothetical protein